VATEARRLEAVNEARIEGPIEPTFFGHAQRAQKPGIRAANLDLRPVRDPVEVKFLSRVLAERPPFAYA